MHWARALLVKSVTLKLLSTAPRMKWLESNAAKEVQEKFHKKNVFLRKKRCWKQDVARIFLVWNLIDDDKDNCQTSPCGWSYFFTGQSRNK